MSGVSYAHHITKVCLCAVSNQRGVLTCLIRCTYNGEADPQKPGKPIAFKVRQEAV